MLFIIVSWVSIIINPDVVPGRMGLLLTTLLVLINIFTGVKSRAPQSTTLNAVDVYLIICIVQVFFALMEYAVVLFLESYKGHLLSPSKVTKGANPPAIPNNAHGRALAWNEQHSSMNKLDSLSLCIFPLVFIIFNFVYWINCI